MAPPPDTDRDTGTALRSQYAAQGGVATIFSSKVADYIAARPDYPQGLFDALIARCPSTAAAPATVADIGAGTGLLTRDLLRVGYRAIAIEPNAEMRAAADASLSPIAGYSSVAGSAEAMPLARHSVNLITAAQAFHWFDIPQARAECERVLVPGGFIALIWNDRVLDAPLNIALDTVFAEYGGARRSALVAHEERIGVTEFFGATPETLTWPHAPALSLAGLQALVFSRSYMPSRESAAGQAAAQRVAALFHQFASDQLVPLPYTTIAMIGPLL